VIADLFKVAVEGSAFLLSMDGIFAGINIQDQSALVSAPKKSIGEAAQAGFEALDPILGGEDVVLKAAKPG
jgi:hypothetical protein